MAQPKKKGQNTSNVDTDIFIKGMSKDPNASLVDKQSWTHAINAINNSADGDVGAIGNEPANKLCSGAPYTIIGTIHLYGDKWVLYSTNNTYSEIGLWDDSECKYERLVNDIGCFDCFEETEFSSCLNFNTQNLITGAAKENYDCTWQVYWDDGVNPSRTLNIDEIPYIQELDPNSDSDCPIYIDTACIDCEKLRLAPLMETPCVELEKSKDGGMLRNGSYQVFIAYAVNGQKIGDYIAYSNVQPLFDHEDSVGGLDIKISNLDPQFDEFQLVICSNNQMETAAKEIGYYSIDTHDISISFINPKLTTVPIETLPLQNPAYEKSDNMYVVNDYLIRQGPTSQFDFNYQPLANQIHTHWTVTQFPADYYKKGGNKPSFMRDEVYAFFIRWIYNTGEKSKSYHIPGRPVDEIGGGYTLPTGVFASEYDVIPGDPNQIGSLPSVGGNADQVWQMYNTAGPAGTYNPNPNQNLVTDDGGIVVAEGHMAYWESTERYPQDPVRYNSNIPGSPELDLCGKPIRHHKFPDQQAPGQNNFAAANNFLDLSSNNNQTINVLGVRFMNIPLPRFNGGTGEEPCFPEDPSPSGDLIPNIVGYEILVGSREGNKSIIAKGLTRNMKQYNIPANAQGHESPAGQQGLYANYPFNSAGADPYLNANANNTFTNATGNEQNYTPYNNNSANAFSDTRDDVYTFHSPETSFNRPFLSPYEIKSYGITTGTALGRFRVSEEHPQQKLLRNISMWVALFVGMGFALGEMRGKRNKKIRRPQMMNIGLRGGVGRATFSGAGNDSTIFTGTLSDAYDNPMRADINVNEGGVAGVDLSATFMQVLKNSKALIGMLPTGQLTAPNAFATRNPSTMRYAPLVAPNRRLLPVGGASADNTAVSGAYQTADGPQAAAEQGAETLLAGGAFFGGPKLGTRVAYEPGLRTAYQGLEALPGMMGKDEEVTFEGSRFEALPSLMQLAYGFFNFLQFSATGGQEIIDLIYNLVSYQDYAWKYNAHGLYFGSRPYQGQFRYRAPVDIARYVGSSMQQLDATLKVNNIQRPATVVVKADSSAPLAFPLTLNLAGGFAPDNSRFIINNVPVAGGGTAPIHFRPTQLIRSNISAHYCALKVNFRNQYGQLEQINQIPIGCPQLLKNVEEVGLDPKDFTVDTRLRTSTLYGGDVYINRYTEKVIMPFFWDFLKGQPDGFPYDYRLRANVPRPRFWMNTQKYDLSELVRAVVTLNFGQNTGAVPSNLFNLDRPGLDSGADTGVGPLPANTTIVPTAPSGAPGGGTTAPGPGDTTNNPPGRSLFHIKNGFMYTHNSGINDFFVESELNVALRDHENRPGKRHFDFLDFTDVNELFTAKDDVIKMGNFYKYDGSLSKNRFFSQLISFGRIQDRDYDPLVAATCYDHYPKRLIYSLQAQLEAKKDFWRVFLPNNYKDFKNKVNVIKPVSKSGALILFPHLAPQIFQGVDTLQTDLGTKLTIGDGGLFSNPMQNVTNADMPHEYGSCESQRSVVNTPSGLFYMSQAQGKIFQYGGQGLVNIANAGMKQWFNKYLPSVLLSQFPEMEDCQGWIDNPVAGVGCQSVYDPNYDLVYFCKKDYEALVPECTDFVPCEGFVYNHTRCDGVEPDACCPPGYNLNQYNAGCPPGFQPVSLLNGTITCSDNNGNFATYDPDARTECCNVYEQDPVSEGGLVAADIVIAVDSSNSVANNGNTNDMRDFVQNFVDAMANELASGDVQVGLVHFGAGKGTTDNMTVAGQQIHLTSTKPDLDSWIQNTYVNAALQNDTPFGTELIGGIWSGMNLLYGLGSRNVPKKLITIFDGPQAVVRTAGPGAGCWTSPADVYGGVAVTPTTPDVNFPYCSLPIPTPQDPQNWRTQGNGVGNNDSNDNGLYNLGSQSVNWFLNNIQNNPTYNTANPSQPMALETFSVIMNTSANIFPNQNQQDYAALFASPGNSYAGNFQNAQSVQNVVAQIIASVTSPVVFSCPDPNCTLITPPTGHPYCECEDCVEPIFTDNTSPLDIHNEDYFKDVSWTVSYDPKSKAWISFHDWHPDLTVPSLNHFFTTKNYDLKGPECPPGFTYDPATGECCQLFEGEPVPAIVTSEYEAPDVTTTIQQADCKIDIVIGIDQSGSSVNNPSNIANNIINNAYGGATWPPPAGTLCNLAAEMRTAYTIIDNLSAELAAGNIQIGLYRWSNTAQQGNMLSDYGGQPFGFVMSNNEAVLKNSLIPNAAAGIYQGSTGMFDGYQFGRTILDAGLNAGQSSLGDRTGDPSYKRIHIFIADGQVFPPQNNPNAANFNPNIPSPNGQANTLINNEVALQVGQVPAPAGSQALANGQATIESRVYAIYASANGAPPAFPAEFNVLVGDNANAPWNPQGSGVSGDPGQTFAVAANTPPNFGASSPNTISNLLLGDICDFTRFFCTCPPGYERITTVQSGSAPPYQIITDPEELCSDFSPDKNGVCRKITCDCTDAIPSNAIFTGQTGTCDDVALSYDANPDWAYNIGPFGDPTYINPDPIMCNYEQECCVPAINESGGMWKHNVRCDLFTNYYGEHKPWEIEWVASVGQVVNTVRSVEYQLESYIYKGDLENNCGDRFHDLDWNFDHAIVYNTEQVSGLLSLNLSPKNNAPLITQFPQITANDIQILYSKEEQKYRFNMFWDITADRGEFDPNVNQSIFITELNGYIRELNEVNLNYLKPQFERKKFRHYWNKVVLRKNESGNRKMILKLANTKLNLSFR
tara:strand:- start:1940 stop:10087 length:8148 start_codon:yes stop_codon:yes gene_type:complete